MARCCGDWARLRVARNRAADAGECIESTAKTPAAANRYRRSPNRRTRSQHSRPKVQRSRAKQKVGGGLHLRLDGGGLALRRRRARSLLAPDRRLVDASSHDGGPRRRCPYHGTLAARTAPRSIAPFRSRYPIHERAEPELDDRTWRHVQPVALRQRLG